MRVLTTIGCLFALAACGKTEKIQTTEERLKDVQVNQETQPDFYAPRKSVDYTADLKSLRDVPTPAAVAKNEAASKGTGLSATPDKRGTITQTPAASETNTAAPAPVAPSPAPTPLVAAAPSPAVTQPPPKVAPAADTAPVIVSRESPSFPREAVRQGIESGLVRARLTINAAGDVSAVTILSARPARVFDREVQTALQRWKFNRGTDGRSYEAEVAFQR